MSRGVQTHQVSDHQGNQAGDHRHGIRRNHGKNNEAKRLVRTVTEWIGKTDDSKIPLRVRIRVFERFQGICQGLCGRKIGPADGWDLDHEIALANGGEHREGNLRPLCHWCHKGKTKKDKATKSKIADTKAYHLGKKEPKTKGFWKPPGTKFNWKTGRYERVE